MPPRFLYASLVAFFRTALVVAPLFLIGATPTAGQAVAFHGQVRPRYEYRNPGADGRDGFTSMRTRLGVSAEPDPGLEVFVQLQDVRVFGEEANTLSDYRADALDIHQAFLRYRSSKADWLITTFGRQEADFGGQRLVGAVDWTQQGRAFDGIRLDVSAGTGLPVALVAYKLADATAPAHDSDAELYGIYATARTFGPGALDVYVLVDRAVAEEATHQSTVGARYAFAGSMSGRVEGSLQRGDRSGSSVSAYMLGARLGQALTVGNASVTLWYDYLSGDEDPDDGKTGAFSTLYATNHKFYGFADLFLDVPAQTREHGLQDLALKLSATPTPWLTARADLHSFRAAERGALSNGHYADELDLTLVHSATAHLTMTSGLSLVRNVDALAEVGRLSRNMTWGYVMFNAVF